GGLYPIPSRTRPLNSPAPMVLSLKTWKSRSLPGLPRTKSPHHDDRLQKTAAGKPAAVFFAQRMASSELRVEFLFAIRHSLFASLFLCLPGRPQRRDAAAERLRLFGEQP